MIMSIMKWRNNVSLGAFFTCVITIWGQIMVGKWWWDNTSSICIKVIFWCIISSRSLIKVKYLLYLLSFLRWTITAIYGINIFICYGSALVPRKNSFYLIRMSYYLIRMTYYVIRMTYYLIRMTYYLIRMT